MLNKGVPRIGSSKTKIIPCIFRIMLGGIELAIWN
jgi:hypothetical protein